MRKAAGARTAKAGKAAPARTRSPKSHAPAPARADPRRPREEPLQALASRLGPGLITGAADDDPSGIATYSQAGAQFRYSLVWTLFLTTPLMIGIQMLSARIGWATSEGLASNIDKICPRWLTLTLVGLLVVANTINIAADVGAMAESLKLIVGGPQPLYVLAFGAVCIATQVLFSYERTVRVLKWLTLTLFAYVAVVLAVSVPWRRAIVESFQPWAYVPAGATGKDFAAMVVAVQPNQRWRGEIVKRPIRRFDWPIIISTTMIGTEITPLTIALSTSALIGSTSKKPISEPMPVAAMMIA